MIYNTSLAVVTGGTCSPPATQWPPGGSKCPTGSGEGCTPRFWPLASTFAKYFFDLSTPSMIKVDDGGEKQGREMGATNVNCLHGD